MVTDLVFGDAPHALARCAIAIGDKLRKVVGEMIRELIRFQILHNLGPKGSIGP
jgi:hypothetical protein